MNDILQKYIEEVAKKIETEKINLIKYRLESLGLSNCFPESSARFKRLICEIDPDGFERYYADNGTDDGVYLIKFKVKTSDTITFTNDQFKLNSELIHD